MENPLAEWTATLNFIYEIPISTSIQRYKHTFSASASHAATRTRISVSLPSSCEQHMQSKRHPCAPQISHSRGGDGYSNCNTVIIDHVRYNDARTTSPKDQLGRARPSPVLCYSPTHPARRRFDPTCSAGTCRHTSPHQSTPFLISRAHLGCASMPTAPSAFRHPQSGICEHARKLFVRLRLRVE